MILIDDRTGSAELEPLISAPSVVCRLDYADFAWSGNGPDGPVDVGVERKGLLDLLQSMTTGRLSGHQMVGLTAQYDWIYLLIEGVWRPDRKNGMLMRIGRGGKWIPAAQGSRRFMARDVYNFVQTLQVMCGVITVTTANRWETGKWLDSAHGWWSKRWSNHKSHLQFQKPVTHAQLRKPGIVTRVATQFDGIGWDKARKIGDHFDSMWDFLNADEEELMEVGGIGKKLAKEIVEQRGE